MSIPLKWLIATNGSKYASNAVKYAGELSAQLNKNPEVTLLVVAATQEEEEIALGIVEMAKFLFEEQCRQDLHPELLVKVGEPGKVVVEVANELGIDHILIGGADFKWDVNDDKPGGISNYIIHHFKGLITVIK